MKRIISALFALTVLCAAGPGFSAEYSKNSDGIYVDGNGQIIEDYWDEKAGIYIVNGVAYEISEADNQGSSGEGAGSPVTDASGGMTVTSSDGATDPMAGVQQNADGSITVESGQIQIEDGSGESSPHLTEAEWAARWAKYSAANGTTEGTVYMDAEGNIFPAEILALGLGRSTIRADGNELIVPTSSLRWETSASEDQMLAVVTPKTQSYITLRAKKSKSSFVMGHCDKCKVLRVIAVGKTWTMVDDEGVRGYVMTSGLTFYDNAPKQYAAAIITINGKVARGEGHTVHVRSSNTKNARQIAEYNAGTPITVFSQDEQWSEIDVAGLHCYILSKFVTLQEPLIVAEAHPEEAPLSE